MQSVGTDLVLQPFFKFSFSLGELELRHLVPNTFQDGSGLRRKCSQKCNFYYNINITILTCEYHKSTIPHLPQGRFDESTTQLQKLEVGSWAINW